MRIAVLDPYPHVCGPSSWAGHVVAGINALGHHGEYVTATKSGKPSKQWAAGGMRHGNRWWRLTPDRTYRTDAVRHDLPLDFDLVILVEPRSIELDRTCKEEGARPWYIDALTAVPWTTALHGPQYEPKLAPFAEELFTAAGPRFAGAGATPNVSYVQTLPNVLGKYRWVERPLPYAARHGADEVVSRRPTVVGMTGRMVYNKGQHLLALIADDLPARWDVELWGSCSIGAGPSFTLELKEALVARGWEVEYDTDPLANPGGGEWKFAMRRPYLWTARKDGRTVTYKGGYEDPVVTCERLAVHVDLTSHAYSTGLAEFVTLEAVDAGCVPVMPQHLHTGTGFKSLVLKRYVDAPTFGKLKTEESQERLLELTAALRMAASVVGDPGAQAELVHRNRAVLAARHDPAAWVKALLDALG